MCSSIRRSRAAASTRVIVSASRDGLFTDTPPNTTFGQWWLDSAVVSLAAMSSPLMESPPSITERQQQVVELIAAGCSNEEVGARLGISARTAKAHCDALRQKLGVARRRQIPVAYRALTGRDQLSKGLEPARAGSRN